MRSHQKSSVYTFYFVTSVLGSPLSRGCNKAIYICDKWPHPSLFLAVSLSTPLPYMCARVCVCATVIKNV